MATSEGEAAEDTGEDDGPPEAFVSALLRNPIRARIMEMLRREPGMNRYQLALHLDIHLNAVEFHIQRLMNAKLVEVRSAGHGQETLCFTAENVSLWEDKTTRALFGRGRPRHVAVYLAEHPGADAKEVADALGLTVETVRRHIRALEESDLVRRFRVDRQVIYHAVPQLSRWVEALSGASERMER